MRITQYISHTHTAQHRPLDFLIFARKWLIYHIDIPCMPIVYTNIFSGFVFQTRLMEFLIFPQCYKNWQSQIGREAHTHTPKIPSVYHAHSQWLLNFVTLNFFLFKIAIFSSFSLFIIWDELIRLNLEKKKIGLKNCI